MWRVTTGLLVCVVVLGACGDPAGDEVLVSAAASLTEAFAEVEAVFEQQNPGSDVVLNLGGSSALREQILGGAPADVFASADSGNMARVVSSEMMDGAPVVFARNRMQIAVPPGNPAGIAELADFGREGLLIGLCAPTVPCGALARVLLDAAGVDAAPDTNEPSVRALLAKIAAGELDAGLVYATDVVAAGDAVTGIAEPDPAGPTTEYQIAVLAAAPNPDGARAFLALVASPTGQGILADHGFLAP